MLLHVKEVQPSANGQHFILRLHRDMFILSKAGGPWNDFQFEAAVIKAIGHFCRSD